MVKRVPLPRLGMLLLLSVVIGAAAWLLGRYGWGYYHYRAAEQAATRHDFGEARLHLDKCLRVWPSDGTTLLLAARAAAGDGDLGEAERLLDAAAKANAIPDAVALERTLLRLRRGDLIDAERYFAACDAHRDKPETTLILEALVEGALKARQVEFAERCLKLWESGTQSYDRVQATIWRGELAFHANQMDVALVHLREAVRSAPNNDAARVRLTEVLIRYEPKEAMLQLVLLREKRPRDRDVLIRLASCHRSLGEHDEAARLLDELLARSPRDVPAMVQRGLVALDLRKLDDAERWFRGAEAIAPQLRDVGLALARCLQLAGKDAEARAYRDKVAKMDAQPQGKGKSP